MIGTILNVAGILIGGLAGVIRRRPLSPVNESFLKVTVGALTVFYGLRLTWMSLNGSFLHMLRQLVIVMVALMLGKVTGRVLQLQKWSNRVGAAARERIAAARPGAPGSVNEGFRTCALLFCAAPLALVGAIQDGVSGYFYPLGVKGLIDGLGTMGFVSLFGRGVILSALPVLAFEGTITLACAQWLRPFLESHGLVDSINATGGLLVFCVALVVLGLKRIELADYLPGLAWAPLLILVIGR